MICMNGRYIQSHLYLVYSNGFATLFCNVMDKGAIQRTVLLVVTTLLEVYAVMLRKCNGSS